MQLSGALLIGYRGGGRDAFDPYGRRPWQKGFERDPPKDETAASFYKLQSDFARLFGPTLRGRTAFCGRLRDEQVTPAVHQSHLQQGLKLKKSKR